MGADGHSHADCRLTQGQEVFDRVPMVACWVDHVLGPAVTSKLIRVRLVRTNDQKVAWDGAGTSDFTRVWPERGLCWCGLEQAVRAVVVSGRLQMASRGRKYKKADAHYFLQGRAGTDELRAALGLPRYVPKDER